MGVHGDPCEGNGLYGTQEAFGQGRFLPSPTRKSFSRPSRISGPVRGPPWGSMVAPYCPFVGQWPIQLPMDPPWWAWLGISHAEPPWDSPWDIPSGMPTGNSHRESPNRTNRPIGPQRDNRDPPWRARAAPELVPKSGKVETIIFWEGLGGNGLAQRPPGHHTIHSPLTESRATPWGTISSTKPSFSRPHVWSKKVPGPAGIQIWDMGSQKLTPGLNIPKSRAAKPGRIHWSMLQMEPYVAS